MVRSTTIRVDPNSLIAKASLLGNPSFYDRIDSFIGKEKTSVFSLIQYTAVLISEIIKSYPKLKFLIQKLIYRVRLLSSNIEGSTEESQYLKKPQEAKLTETQLYYAVTFRKIYGYISDINIAQGIFAIIPYLSTFLKNYNTIKKLRQIDSTKKLNDFVDFALFASYTVYENLGFLLSHDFISDNFKILLLPEHKKNKSLSTSDWYYVYSCRIWFAYNAIETLKGLKKGASRGLNFNLLCDLVLSYHWGSTTGVLDGPSFAVIGFANTITRFSKKLQ